MKEVWQSDILQTVQKWKQQQEVEDPGKFSACRVVAPRQPQQRLQPASADILSLLCCSVHLYQLGMAVVQRPMLQRMLVGPSQFATR